MQCRFLWKLKKNKNKILNKFDNKILLTNKNITEEEETFSKFFLETLNCLIPDVRVLNNELVLIGEQFENVKIGDYNHILYEIEHVEKEMKTNNSTYHYSECLSSVYKFAKIEDVLKVAKYLNK